MNNTAFLDIGTNTLILLIAQIAPNGTFEILHDECRIARLGEGIDKNGCFKSEAMERAFAILTDYKTIIEKFQCTKTISVGTAACRNASNALVFLERVEKELSIKISVISGKEEARLIHLGSIGGFEQLTRPILVLDIGGGSTEFIFDDGTRIDANSLPFGVVKLTERFLHSDPPHIGECNQLIDFVMTTLKESLGQHSVSGKQRPQLIATAGTPTTLAALVQGLTAYDATKVHGISLKKIDLQMILNRLSRMTLEEREKVPCLPANRADVIVAGLLILKTVLEFFKLNSFWVSDRGLRFGVLLDFVKTVNKKRQ